ncbi:MAG: hypothetical protein WBB18_13585 [Nodosilinea sp.]
MTLNRQRFLRYAEYAAVSASVTGAIISVATRQLIYGIAPLSIAAALNLANRRQWEGQVEQQLAQTTTQVEQRFERLSHRNKRIEQRLRALPQSASDISQGTDLQALREENSRLIQALADDIQSLRQSLAQQVTHSSLEVTSADLRQVQLSLAAVESLNVEARLQALEQQLSEVQTWKNSRSLAVAQLNTDFGQLRADLTQLRRQVEEMQARLKILSSEPEASTTSESLTEVTPPADFQWVPPQLPSAQNFTLEINLGIDFGTGFTKVCFRDLASDRSEVVTFTETDDIDLEQALLPTRVAILKDGTLVTGLTSAEWAKSQHPILRTIEFIKMRLAHLDLPEEAEWRLDQIPELDNPETVENICAYFLCSVIIRAQEWIQHNRADLFINQTTRWSLNTGVPVAYCESPALDRFRRVLSLAWLLANTPSSKQSLTIDSLNQVGTYLRQWMQQNQANSLDCFTTPEISAAVWSFLSSRQALEKFYTFFDFGDGTLDGTAFRFWREDEGELKVDFYAGQVRPLGVTAFTQQTALELQASPEAIHQALLDWLPATNIDLHSNMRLCKTRRQVQQFVAAVVIGGKNQHRKNRGLVANNELGDQLDVFIGGGGGHNQFLESTVQATYNDFQHKNAGVPPYQIRRIPVPNNLSMNGLDSREFHRFAVAYGLCIPSWEGPEIRLPSEVESNVASIPCWPEHETRHEDMQDLM